MWIHWFGAALATVPPTFPRTEPPLASAAAAVSPRCGPAPGLRLRPTLQNPAVDVFEAPDVDPWPGLTPGGDNATWARVAQALRNGRLPSPGSARAEEVVAALPTDDPPPPPGEDLIVRTETATTPWDRTTALVRIAVTTRRPRPLDRAPVHLAVVVDSGADTDTGLVTARAAVSELASALRPDDSLALVDSAGLRWTGPTTGDDLFAAIDRMTPSDRHDLSAALVAGYESLAHLDGARRVILVSDGDLSLIEDGDRLSALVADGAAGGVSLATVGYGDLHGRDEGLESLARAAGGTYLHLRGGDDARRLLGDALAPLVEPVLNDVRLVVEWGPGVSGVHRTGNHLDRLRGLGPAEPSGSELGAGRTAVVVYEVQLAPGSSPLGTVRVRSTPVSTGIPRVDTAALATPAGPLSEASPSMQIAVAASTFAELLSGSRSFDRIDDLEPLATRARRPEYAEDAELVELVGLALPLLRERRACPWW